MIFIIFYNDYFYNGFHIITNGFSLVQRFCYLLYKGFSYFLQWFHHTTILKHENNDFGVVYNDIDFYNGYLYFDTTISNIF